MDGEKDLRKNPRHRVLKQGKVISADMTTVVNVTIRNMSAEGLRIQIPMSVLLPLDFNVLIISESLIYPVTMRWRKGDFMGVEFVGPPNHVGEYWNT